MFRLFQFQMFGRINTGSVAGYRFLLALLVVISVSELAPSNRLLLLY